MAERRKDNKGRVLKTGESQRKDMLYQYRYTDIYGKRKTIYSSDLQELRRKEKEIQKNIDDGLNYSAGKIKVIDLIERYISLKKGLRYNTRSNYAFAISVIKKEEFAYRQIGVIKTSDAKQWIIKLHKDGRGYSTITSVRNVIKPAFQMAYDEDIIRKNPFDFKLSDIIPNNTQKRVAMTNKEQKIWMDFIKNDKTYCKYYDEFVVLLQTGLRVSEFCGLTMSDIDFKKRTIKVDHQLIREATGKYYIEKTKTKNGVRYLPMTDDVYRSLKNIVNNRPKLKTEMIIDGYSRFILLDKNLNPKIALHIENEMRWAMKKYKKLYPNVVLPHITPHVFRHTFCTNMANAGMEVKTLQYLMGHSDVSVTLNVYTHSSYEHVKEQMEKVMNLDVINLN